MDRDAGRRGGRADHPTGLAGQDFRHPKPEAGRRRWGAGRNHTGAFTAKKPPRRMAKNWNPDLHLRDNRGRFAYCRGGSAGPRGRTTDAETARVQKHMSILKLRISRRGSRAYYEWNVSERHQIYEENKTLLDKNLLRRPSTNPIQSYFPATNDIPTKKPIPEALNCGRKYFLMMGRPNQGSPKGNLGECVSLVANLTGITTDTKKWRGGAKVIDTANIKPGTAIASFDDKRCI